jgi:hypothetical protein
MAGKIGMGLLETLLENLDRDLNLADTTLTNPTITTSAAATFSGGCLSHNWQPSYTGSTTLSADATLVKNTLNIVTDTATSVYALPAAASSAKGDTILVRYNAVLGNTNIHDFGTAGEFFAAHSHIINDAGSADGNVYAAVTAANGTSNDFLKLTGATNGGPGIGTELYFWFDGSNWCVLGDVKSSGTGVTAPTVAFADTSG